MESIKNLLHDRKRLIKVIAAAAAVYASQKLIEGYLIRKEKKSFRSKTKSGKLSGDDEGYTTGTESSSLATVGQRKPVFPGLDRRFYRELSRLIKIMIPGPFSREAAILFMHSAILFVRTFLTIYVASVESRLTKAIVRTDVRSFLWQLSKFLLIAVPATFVNSMIRYFESYLGLAFRTRLVQYSYKKYFSNETYYRVTMLDSRLANADQCLTEDITMFANMVARLYSQLTKPVLDIALISLTLFKYADGRGSNLKLAPMIAAATIFMTAGVLRGISPKFGKLVAEEAKRKGHLRYVHGRLITNAEEIAFYGGHKVEHSQLKKAYNSLVSQMSQIYRKRIFYIMMEQFLMKYVWTAAGMIMISVPALTMQHYRESDQEELEADGGLSARAAGIAFGKNLLSSAADAIERLMSSYKEITELGGYTSRVSEMLNVFDDVAKNRYKRNALPSPTGSQQASTKRWDISRIEGKIIEDLGLISLEGVPIVTPTGDVVVESISIEIKRGMHLLISGPNGCGKSSLFRILGGLWPVYRGILRKPPASALFYIPQRPYLSLGTLRDQLIYPDTQEDMVSKGFTDDDLANILRVVHLSPIVEREGGWDAKNDWMDVFSGGEKQRIGLARIFYHRPTFAILDECTSAVSIDVEGSIYQAAKGIGITLLTVTHRPSLWKYHTHILQFDGSGAWSFSALDGSLDKRMSLAEEKQRLESKLSSVPEIRERLREICTALGDDSALLKE